MVSYTSGAHRACAPNPRQEQNGITELGVGEDFSTFRANNILSRDEIQSISIRYRRITRQLNRDFYNQDSETLHSWYVGSYGRDTAAKGVSDLDIGFVLPNHLYHKYDAYKGNGQSALLQSIKQSIQRTYATSDAFGDGQVVVIKFRDGITFEVLPAFLNSDGVSWTYPNTNDGGSWRVCNPMAEIRAIADRSAVTNRNLKHLCRMMRIWRDRHAVPISGMLIDTLAYNFIEDWEYRDKSYLYHDFMARDFFKYMYNQRSTQTHWLAPGSRSYVYRKGPFEYRAGQAYKLSLNAIQYNDDRFEWSRRQKWREIFGPLYPG